MCVVNMYIILLAMGTDSFSLLVDTVDSCALCFNNSPCLHPAATSNNAFALLIYYSTHSTCFPKHSQQTFRTSQCIEIVQFVTKPTAEIVEENGSMLSRLMEISLKHSTRKYIIQDVRL